MAGGVIGTVPLAVRHDLVVRHDPPPPLSDESVWLLFEELRVRCGLPTSTPTAEQRLAWQQERQRYAASLVTRISPIW